MYALHSVTGNLRELEKGISTPAFSGNKSKATTFAPGSITRHLDGKTRNIVRTLRNLRDDLKRLHPKEVMPSTWMIKCLVASCHLPASRNENRIAHTENWDSCVIGVMQRLLVKTENAFEIRNGFFEMDGVTPLFPNYELFGPQHANRFAKLAIRHLKIQLGKDDNAWSARAIP